jgi:tetratricopeptide (TPR) repeat protein
MRTFTSLLLPALFTTALFAAQAAPDALMGQAEQAYSAGDHRKALALYDSLNAHRTSAALLFNIGNCWSKLGDVPHAILYYERALRLAPGAEDIQANLDLERTKVVDRMNELPGFALASAWDRLQGGTDVDHWARISLWACALTAFAAGVALLVRPRTPKRALGLVAGIALVATTASTALAAYRIQQVRNASEAIIMSPKVDVLSEPREGAAPAFVLHQGTKVRVMKREKDWCEVKIPSGAVGWMPAKESATI